MATTTPRQFTGTPTLDDDKIAHFKRWYEVALGDCDKAGDVNDAAYYQGVAEAFESVLALLFDQPLVDPDLAPVEPTDEQAAAAEDRRTEDDLVVSDSDPEPTDCTNCGERIEPDDGGAIWYHAETMSAFCDPEGAERLTRQAEPGEGR